jgi:hypothetical protein
MWNCRSKLNLGDNVVLTRADGNVRAFCLSGSARHSVRAGFVLLESSRAKSREPEEFTLRFATGFFDFAALRSE